MRAVVLLVAAGCGRVAFDSQADAGGVDGASADGVAPLKCGPWSTTATLLTDLASANDDWDPALSPDGTLMVFASSRMNPGFSQELYMATRMSATTFSAPTLLSSISPGTVFDGGPTWTPDGTQIYFQSNRNSGDHLWVSNYSQGAFSPPVQIDELSTMIASAPCLSPDGLELYWDDYTAVSITSSIHRAERATLTSPWTVTGVESQLSVGGNIGWPGISPDGLTMYFEGDAGGTAHLYETHRPSTSERFGTPAVMPDFDSGAHDFGDPYFSPDSQTLFYTAATTSGTTGFDIFLVTRTCN
jgi:Tol biopolymer transport system component